MAQERYIPRPTTWRGKLDWQMANFSIYWASPYFEKGLSDKEKRYYQANVENIQAGRYLSISDEIDDVVDHEIWFWGAEHLEQLDGKAFIVVANHWNNGPLDGNWHPQATSFVVKELLGREMTWVQGPGKEKFHPLIEKTGFHDVVAKQFVGRVHKRIAAVNRSIYTEEPDVAKQMHRTLQQGGILGLCPELKQTTSLEKADSRAGDLLFIEARAGIPVIGVASFQVDKDAPLVVAITDVLEPETIRSFGDKFPEEDRGQAVIDFVFGGFIAQQMPENLRGYYKDILQTFKIS